MTYRLLIYLLIGAKFCHGYLSEIIPIFSERFKAPVQLPIFYDASKEVKILLTKNASMSNIYPIWLENPYSGV